MKTLLKNLFRDEEGATLTEYIILLVLILVVAIGLVKAFGVQVKKLWQDALDAIM